MSAHPQPDGSSVPYYGKHRSACAVQALGIICKDRMYRSAIWTGRLDKRTARVGESSGIGLLPEFLPPWA